MSVALLMTFLKANWKPLVILVAILSLGGYIQFLRVDVEHYKTKYQNTQLALDTLVKNSKDKEDKLAADAKAATAKYQNTLRDANLLIVANAKLNAENIQNAKELRNVKLSLATVQLFNASKQSTTEANQPPTAKQGDAPTTSTTENVTLQDLLLIGNENDANHLKCIKQVEDWQKLWKDTEAIVEKYNAQN